MGRIRIYLALGLYAILFSHLRSYGPLTLLFRNRTFLICMLFMIVDLLSRIIFNWDSSDTWQTAKLDFTLISIALWTYMVFSERASIARLPWVIVVVVSISSAISFLDYRTGQAAIIRFTGGLGEQRLDPNDTAYVICWGLLTGLFLLIKIESKALKILLTVLLMIMTVGLILTGSRAGLIILLLGVTATVISKRSIKMIVLVSTMVVFISTFLLIYQDSLPQSQRSTSILQITSMEDFFELDTNTTRLPAQKAALVAWLSNPVLGIGGGRFINDSPAFFTFQSLFVGIGPHNTYLIILAELGLLGFFCYIWWLFTIYKGIRKHGAYGLAAPLLVAIIAGFSTTTVPGWHILFVLTGILARLDALTMSNGNLVISDLHD